MIIANIGVLQNSFLCWVLALVSLGLSIGIFRRFRKQPFYLLPCCYGLHWLFIGCSWLLISASLYFSWNQSVTLASNLFLASLVSFVVSFFFLLVFLFVTMLDFKKLKIIVILAAALMVVSVLGLVFYYPPVFDQINFWNSRWLISSPVSKGLTVILFIPSVLGCLGVLFREIYLYFKNRPLFNNLYLASAPIIIVYLAIFLADWQNLVSDSRLIVLRLVFFLAVFMVYLAFLHRKIDISILKNKEYKLRFSLMFKNIFYFFLITVVPLTLAGLLLYFTFDILIFNITYKNYPELISRLREQLIVTIVMISLLSFFLSLIAGRFVVERVQIILQGISEILKGNFHVRLQDVGVKDEISALSKSFNDMAQTLSDYQEDIVMYSQTLEKKVKERSLDLQKKTEEADELRRKNESFYKELEKSTDIIMDNMDEGLLVLDSFNKVIRANVNFLEKFNLTSADIMGVHLAEIAILKDYPDLEKAVNTLQQQHLESYDCKIKLKPPLTGMFHCRLTDFEITQEDRGVIILLREISIPWGVVYNSFDMSPLTGVKVNLYNEKNDKIVGSEVTDTEGRYSFFAAPGSYYLKAFKEDYHFPAKNPLGYHGEVINILSKEEGLIRLDILMDGYHKPEPKKEINKKGVIEKSFSKPAVQEAPSELVESLRRFREKRVGVTAITPQDDQKRNIKAKIKNFMTKFKEAAQTDKKDLPNNKE